MILKESLLCAAILMLSVASYGCNKGSAVEQGEQQAVEQLQGQPDPVYNHETIAQAGVTEPTEQLLLNLIVAASNSLRTINASGAGVEYEARFTIAQPDNATPLDNCLMIFPKESNTSRGGDQVVLEGKESCRACGLTSGYDCVKKVVAKLRASEDKTLDVSLHMDGDCVVIEY
jgi:lipoprotein